ncbi:uncharacterized protein LOC127804330 [Diospyros lotus]|uniref:uncharacterized protein LOC127804330 n=1 Tax=Diospyros lotus TaxID=55363 RepID=UPI0022547E66|nr:uncharacterized protein LOC127804330 [Diospyros lotus]
MPRPLSKFHINARNIFLTYPQCSLSKEDYLQQIINLQYPIKPMYIWVCQEVHQDGSPHLHCLVQFDGKFQTRSQKFFDLVSLTRSAHFHPNMQPTKSCSVIQSYIAKGGNYIDWGTFWPHGQNKVYADKMSDVYTVALATRDKMKALEVVQKGDARDNVKPERSRPMSIILEAPSQTGKTCWARSLGPHNYYIGHLDMGRHDDDAWYNIIDDVAPQYLKHWKEFIGVDKGWSPTANTQSQSRSRGDPLHRPMQRRAQEQL